jgi:hypothetical protein
MLQARSSLIQQRPQSTATLSGMYSFEMGQEVHAVDGCGGDLTEDGYPS